MTELIAGAGGSGGKGGGGGGARTPTTARDSLDSRQYAEVLDLVSEGEIEGLKDGFKSIFLDNTPLQNPDGSFNFQNVTVYTRNGTQNQDAIPFATAIQDERPVNVTVRNDGPVTRTITDSQTDAVRITINVPRLERITNEGDTVLDVESVEDVPELGGQAGLQLECLLAVLGRSELTHRMLVDHHCAGPRQA